MAREKENFPLEKKNNLSKSYNGQSFKTEISTMQKEEIIKNKDSGISLKEIFAAPLTYFKKKSGIEHKKEKIETKKEKPEAYNNEQNENLSVKGKSNEMSSFPHRKDSAPVIIIEEVKEETSHKQTFSTKNTKARSKSDFSLSSYNDLYPEKNHNNAHYERYHQEQRLKKDNSKVKHKKNYSQNNLDEESSVDEGDYPPSNLNLQSESFPVLRSYDKLHHYHHHQQYRHSEKIVPKSHIIYSKSQSPQMADRSNSVPEVIFPLDDPAFMKARRDSYVEHHHRSDRLTKFLDNNNQEQNSLHSNHTSPTHPNIHSTQMHYSNHSSPIHHNNYSSPMHYSNHSSPMHPSNFSSPMHSNNHLSPMHTPPMHSNLNGNFRRSSLVEIKSNQMLELSGANDFHSKTSKNLFKDNPLVKRYAGDFVNNLMGQFNDSDSDSDTDSDF